MCSGIEAVPLRLYERIVYILPIARHGKNEAAITVFNTGYGPEIN